MKKLFLFTLLSVFCVGAYAQTGISVGAQAGLNIPQIEAVGSNPMSKGYTSRLAGNAGLFAEFHFTPLISLETGLEYTQQGGKRNGMQSIPTAMLPATLTGTLSSLGYKYLYADFKSETKFNYLMLPIRAKFTWDLGANSPFKVFCSAGPFISVLMSAKQETTGQSYMYIDARGDMTLDYLLSTLTGTTQGLPGNADLNGERSIKSEMRKVNVGVSATVGFSYNLSARHKIYLQAGGNYGFIKLQSNPENGQNRIGAATVSVGYAIRIKN